MGVRTYDHATDNAFIMRAALMWTVNNLPANGMASRWSTSEVMGCLLIVLILNYTTKSTNQTSNSKGLGCALDGGHETNLSELVWNVPSP
ncbi:UNVERIFIED_CONTAM: hypothetical protein Sradi_4880000 [Sesamum radiatum]|uniref:Uncharacterized protein n=1 Tax=Sesamum radiatum TaxID=300843 RepID=A0AAW2N2E3_SESRA